LTWFFLFKLRILAARKKVRFVRSPHAVFVYGYEVVRWGGWVARFVMPGVGAMPIHHSKMDSKGMARIYDAIVKGPYPLALAPEGQVSYTSDSVPGLEPGVIRIGFHAANRLKEKGLDCPVEILPISIHFRYGSWGIFTLEFLLRKVERACGIPYKGRKKMPFTERARQCRDHILVVNEARYQIQGNALPFEERIDLVVNAALSTAERMIGVKSEGEIFPRLYRMYQLFWDRIFIPGVESLEGMTRIEHSTMDLQAGEAWYIGRHLDLVDFCRYFRIPLPAEDAALHIKIEYAQNLWDFANRTMGGAFRDRVNIFPRKVIIKAAPVINLSERLPAFHDDKKTAITAALSDLEKAYMDCINEANKTEKG
jgi:hypothetical protein